MLDKSNPPFSASAYKGGSKRVTTSPNIFIYLLILLIYLCKIYKDKLFSDAVACFAPLLQKWKRWKNRLNHDQRLIIINWAMHIII
jgi:hypothetical protein